MADFPHGDDPDLRQYIQLLLRRKWLVVLIVLLAVASSMAYSFTQPTVYEAQAQVILRGGAASTVISQAGTVIPIEQTIDAERRIMGGANMRIAIEKQLGYLPDVKLVTADKSPTITIFHRSGTAIKAARGASDYAKAFVAERRKQIDQDLNSAMKDTETHMANLDVQTAQKKERIRAVAALLKTDLPAKERLQRESELQRLNYETAPSTVNNRQNTLQNTLDQLNNALGLNQTRGTFTLALADRPKAPILPRPVLNALIALLTGLLVGIGVAFARDYFDDTVRTKDDLERIASGVPVLGIIPAIKPWQDKEEAVLETMERPGSPVSEAYRALRTAVEFTGVGREFRLIHVTSAGAGEGKSTTACNLAVALARSGKDVILVDCDLRRPRSHKFFGLDNGVGFTTLLLGTSSVEQSLQPIRDVPGLFVIPSGPLPPNPSELLDSGVTTSQLELLAKSAAFVIVDSPPLLPVADSIILGGHADATLLVIRARSTNGRSIARALELLDQVDAPVAGIVLNGVGEEGTYGYDYDYGYQGEDPRFSPGLKQRSREMVEGHAELSNADAAEDVGGPTRT